MSAHTGRCCGRKPCIPPRYPLDRNAVSLSIREPGSERRGTPFERIAQRPASQSGRTIMKKRIAGLLVFVLAVMLVPAALPQGESTPIVYTYVSQFQVPRANWAAYSEDTEKSFVPVVQKSLADGTILSWSTFGQVVHTPDGYTHGAAWSSNSIPALINLLH